MKDQLTSKQQQVLDYIKKKIAGNMPPTVREIAGEFGIKSPNGVACHLRALEKKGHITRNQHVSRGIRLVAEDEVQVVHLGILGSVKIGDSTVKINSIGYPLNSDPVVELQITHPDSMEVKKL